MAELFPSTLGEILANLIARAKTDDPADDVFISVNLSRLVEVLITLEDFLRARNSQGEDIAFAKKLANEVFRT